MMSTWFAAVLALAAIPATYFFCARPGLRGRRATGQTRAGGNDAGWDRELARLREELRVLRAQDKLDAGEAAPESGPPPGER